MDKNKRGGKSESIKLRKIKKKTKIIPGMNKKIARCLRDNKYKYKFNL